MNANATLSRRPLRRFWGWGCADARLDAHEQAIVRAMVTQAGAEYADRPAPQVAEFDLPAPRIAPPAALAGQFSSAPLDRLNHSVGKSYADCARMWLRRPPPLPDW